MNMAPCVVLLVSAMCWSAESTFDLEEQAKLIHTFSGPIRPVTAFDSVSVVVPCYNCSHHVLATLTSIEISLHHLNQTLTSEGYGEIVQRATGGARTAVGLQMSQYQHVYTCPCIGRA